MAAQDDKAHDKRKTCKGCPDRAVGCHSTCEEGYILRRKTQDEINARKKKERDARSFYYQEQENVRKLHKALSRCKKFDRKKGEHG